MNTARPPNSLASFVWAFAIAVYLEWVVILLTKHFDDFFRYGALHYPLSSREGLIALFAFCVLFLTLMRRVHARRDALRVALMALPAMAFNSYFGIGAMLS